MAPLMLVKKRYMFLYDTYPDRSFSFTPAPCYPPALSNSGPNS